MMGAIEGDDMHASDSVDVADDNNDLDKKQRTYNKVKRSHSMRGRRSRPRVELLLTKPSYTLRVGSMNVCLENRIRLRHLLRKLVAQHNWVDASGVLSALLKGTCRERSPQNNRMKYWVAMEVIRQVESDSNAYTSRIEYLYGTWREKIKAYKSWPTKDRSLMLEYILSCLGRNNHDFARNNLHSLQNDCESARDPRSNLVLGLTNYEFWYSELPEEMKVENLEESCMPMKSETVQNNSSEEIDTLKGEDAASIFENFSSLHYHSETSVVNDKDIDANVNRRLDGNFSDATPVEHNREAHSQDFYMKSAETSDENDSLMQDDHYQYHCSSAYNLHSLQSLLPIKVPSSEYTMDVISSHRRFFGDNYKEAVKYLKLALQSSPPVSEAALLPLIQLLLVGGHAKEAISVLDQPCNESSSILSNRLKARLLECFDAFHYDKLSVCCEDVMKKDPTCRYSLARLLDLHQKGKYAPERLVEMLALHLEATYGDHNIWKDLAMCLLKLSLGEEDRMSMCVDGDRVESQQTHSYNFCRTPALFVEGITGKSWKFRCKWWLNRHFSKRILSSEMVQGDLQFMAYKAACASHFYGKAMDYVVRVHNFVNEHVNENDRKILSFLQTHMQNSVGFFPNIVRK